MAEGEVWRSRDAGCGMRHRGSRDGAVESGVAKAATPNGGARACMALLVERGGRLGRPIFAGTCAGRQASPYPKPILTQEPVQKRDPGCNATQVPTRKLSPIPVLTQFPTPLLTQINDFLIISSIIIDNETTGQRTTPTTYFNFNPANFNSTSAAMLLPKPNPRTTFQSQNAPKQPLPTLKPTNPAPNPTLPWQPSCDATLSQNVNIHAPQQPHPRANPAANPPHKKLGIYET